MVLKFWWLWFFLVYVGLWSFEVLVFVFLYMFWEWYSVIFVEGDLVRFVFVVVWRGVCWCLIFE